MFFEKKYLLIFGVCLLLSWRAIAQQNPSPYERYTTYMVTLRGGIALPQSGLSNYIDTKGGFYAVSFEWVLRNNIAIGAELANMPFTKSVPRQVYRSADGTDVSAVQNRAFNVVPLTIIGSYFLSPTNNDFRPYIQAGVGIAYVDYTNYWGYLLDAENKMKLTARAAVGAKYILKKTAFGAWGADARIAYQLTPFEYGFATGANTLGATVGVFYRWW